MQVVQELLSPCEVSLEIEVEPEKVATAVGQVYREYAQYITVPGFRKGKAPLNFVKQRVTQAQLRERTAEVLVEPAYKEALEQETLKPFSAPKLELVNLDVTDPYSFKFKALVSLPPKVELGEYKGVEMERVLYSVTDEAVESRLNALRDRASEYPVVTDRPSQIGDILVLMMTTTVEDAETDEPKSQVIELGNADNVPGLDDELTGLVIGDQKEFTLTLPDTFPNPEQANKNIHFAVSVNELHAKISPALDDEFARKFGNVDTIDAFRQSIRAELEKSMSEVAQQKMETALVDKIVASSQVEYPTVLREQEVNEEVQALLADLKQRGMELQDWLAQSGQSSDDVVAQIEERSNTRIRRGLVLGDIAQKESLLVSAADIDKEIEERATTQRTTPEAMRAFIEANKQRDLVVNTAQSKKVLSFLASSAKVTDKVINPDDDPITEQSIIDIVDEIAAETPGLFESEV